tara:strand:- start:207 stop:905 length:699 start_codon:yes stop_codon:yes gene_type:complete
MIDGRKVLAIIPARGGSKRLPRKNILPLAGKPLIAWTIDAAIKSQVFAEVMVNTDDEEIENISKKYGAKVPFIRSASLAGDNSSSIDVITNTLLWYQNKGVHFTDVILLQPTSPLRSEDHIIQAWDLYIKEEASSVTSICKLSHPYQWTYSLSSDNKLNGLFNDNEKRSQDYPDSYRLNGAIYINSAKQVLSQNSILSNENCLGFIMNENKSIDIDNESDFELAAYYLDKLK